MRKVYDCFSFFQELDLLELRLQELWDLVDYFVIAEANTTHSGKSKNFVFLDNLERFKPYLQKIRYVKVEDMPGVIDGNCWHNERHQRNCLVNGLWDASDNDILLNGDLDEFIRPSSLQEVLNDDKHTFWGFRMPVFNFKFNYMWTDPLIYQVQTQGMTVGTSKRWPNFSYIREVYGTCWANRPTVFSNEWEKCLQHAGWHFSSFGDSELVAAKYRSFAHREVEFLADTMNVDTYISQNKSPIELSKRFEAVVLDDYFPKTVLENQEKYQNYIIKDANKLIRDLLPCLE